MCYDGKECTTKKKKKIVNHSSTCFFKSYEYIDKFSSALQKNNTETRKRHYRTTMFSDDIHVVVRIVISHNECIANIKYIPMVEATKL